jgi:hypothetical protein
MSLTREIIGFIIGIVAAMLALTALWVFVADMANPAAEHKLQPFAAAQLITALASKLN